MLQPTIPSLPSSLTLASRTVLITGSNTGIGLALAHAALAQQASRVILTSRSASAGSAAVATLRATHPSSSAVRIECLPLDLDSYASVAALAKTVAEDVGELDVLINNAGVNMLRYEIAGAGGNGSGSGGGGGHERVVQVNAYAPAVLTLALLPVLRRTARRKGRAAAVVWTGSAMHTMHTLASKPVPAGESIVARFDDRKRYSGMNRYQDSKLMVAAFVKALAVNVKPEEVVVYHACPGMVATGFDRSMPFWLKPFLLAVRSVVARTLDEGARAVLWGLAFEAEAHGGYVKDGKLSEPSPWLEREEGRDFIERFWQEMLEEAKSVGITMEEK